MFSYQRSSSQKFLILLGVTVLGTPLAVWFAFLVAQYASLWAFVSAFTIGLVIWLTICAGVRALARWLGLRTTLIEAGMFLISIPLAYVFAKATSSALVFFWFFAFWSILSGLLTRSGRGMYVALHLANWLFFVGIFAAFGLAPYNSFPFLAIPLGIMIILLGLYRPVTNRLVLFPFMHHEPSNPAGPKPSPSERAYETGYQASYEEGGRSYTYSSEQEKPIARYPSGTIQQQKQ